jgi:hypothetical protein
LRVALLSITEISRGRGNPVALETNPISEDERKRVLEGIQRHSPGIDLYFWAFMMDDFKQS